MDLNRGAVCAEEEEASQLNAKQSPTITNKIWMQPSSQQLTLLCLDPPLAKKSAIMRGFCWWNSFLLQSFGVHKKKGVAEK